MNPPAFFTAADGTRLSYRVVGEGRPLLLLHGFFSSGTANWVGNRHARLLVERGHRLVIPDLRGHGRSELPHGADSYPADVLVDDTFALLERLGVEELDAAGYSLGGRTVIRMLARGAPIRRAVIGGQGLEALTQVAGQSRTSFARRVLDAEGPLADPVQEWFARQWRRREAVDQQALRHVLDSSIGTSFEEIRAISVPTLIVMGDGDDVADGRALAGSLGNASYAQVAGDHVRAAGNAELAVSIADFLAEDH